MGSNASSELALPASLYEAGRPRYSVKRSMPAPFAAPELLGHAPGRGLRVHKETDRPNYLDIAPKRNAVRSDPDDRRVIGEHPSGVLRIFRP
jgi:hypothetical protein